MQACTVIVRDSSSGLLPLARVADNRFKVFLSTAKTPITSGGVHASGHRLAPPLCAQPVPDWDKAHVTRGNNSRFANLMFTAWASARADFLLDPQELTLACKVSGSGVSSFRSGNTAHQLFHGTRGSNHMVRLRIKRVWLKVGRQQSSVTIHNYSARVQSITEPGGRARGSVGVCRWPMTPVRAPTTARGRKRRITPRNQTNPFCRCRDASRICRAMRLSSRSIAFGVFHPLAAFKEYGPAGVSGVRDHSRCLHGGYHQRRLG